MNIVAVSNPRRRQATVSLAVAQSGVLLIVALALAWLAARAGHAAEVNSTYGGNANGSWNEPTDWIPNGVPNNSPPDMFNVTFNAGAASVSNDVAIEKFTFGGGTLKHTGLDVDIVVNKKMTWTSGSIGQNVRVVANGGLAIGPAGATPPGLSGTLLNNQNATLTGATLSAVSVRGKIQNSGRFTIQDDSGISVIDFENKPTGKLVKAAGTGTSKFDFSVFTNRGRVEVKSGTLDLLEFTQETGGNTVVSQGAKLKSVNDLTFLGGQLTGLGIVEAPNVINGGRLKATLANNAKLEIRADVQMDTGNAISTFDSAVGGPGWDPDYASLVDVTGNAILGGRLLVRVWPGYTPNPDFEYYIMTVGGTLSGYFTNAFDGQRINTVGRQGSFVVHYGSPGYEHEVSLEDWGPAVVPEPASGSLMLLGALIAGVYAQRRPRT